MASLFCQQPLNQDRSLTIAYNDIYAYSRAWTVKDDPLNVFGRTADTRLFCAYQKYGLESAPIEYNQTQDLCDETLGLGMVLQRPWAGCYADIGYVPYIEPFQAAAGYHEDTWCWLWESSYTCDVMIDQLLNENKNNASLPPGALSTDPVQHLITSLGSIGCNPFIDPVTQRTKTSCLFENPNGNYIHPSRPHVLAYSNTDYPNTIRWHLSYYATCSVKSASFNGFAYVDSQSDYRYKPICCSINNVNEMLVDGSNTLFQVDPITGGSLTPLVCDESWCLDDPYGACRDMFLTNCTGTSSCNRHNYLSTYNPVLDPQVDPVGLELLQVISVSGYSPQPQPFGGLPCNAYYKKTRELSAALNRFAGDNFSVTLFRISEIQEQVSSYCTDPSTRGNGECGCLRGYQSLGAGFTSNTNSPSALEGNSLQQISVTFFSVPSPIKNFSHRVDLFCNPYGPNSSSFTGLLSYSSVDGETTCTNPTDCVYFSNACSSLTDAGQYALLGGTYGKKYPSLNPNGSLLSSTNYGDAITFVSKVPGVFYGNPDWVGDAQRNPFSIPYRCWLPACVDPLVQDVVFNDLLQNSPCPDVCYAYGGSQAIDMTNVNANVISMGNFVNQCNYDGNSASVNVDPFILPATMMNGFQFDVPQGYVGSLTFNIYSPEIDVATVAVSKTVAIFTDIPQFISVTQDVSVLYKYSYTHYPPLPKVGAHDSVSVTLSVNATSPNPSYYQMNMYLQDNNLGSMRIPITLNIFTTQSDPESESNWPRACAFYTDSLTSWQDAKCHVVDCFFGSNSVLTNAVRPPFCDGGGLQGINFDALFGVNRGLLEHGEQTRDGVPNVTRISPAVLPVLNYPEQSTVSLFNSSDITAFGFAQLLQTHVQLFGPGPSQSPPMHRTNPRFNIVG